MTYRVLILALRLLDALRLHGRGPYWWLFARAWWIEDDAIATRHGWPKVTRG